MITSGNWDWYQDALEQTDPMTIGTVPKGSAEEQAAIDRFADFFASITGESVRSKINQVYADDVYFYDTLKELRGVDKLKEYLLTTSENTEQVSVEILDVAESRGNYYYRWKMNVQFKKIKKGEVISSTGMTHIRFNQEGKVVLQYEYWDTGQHLYQHLPYIGWLVKKVHAKF